MYRVVVIRKLAFVVCGIALLLGRPCVGAREAEDSPVEQSEVRAVEARKKWTNGEFDIETNYTVYDREGKAAGENIRKSYVAFHEDRVRIDMQRSDFPGQAVRNVTIVDGGQVLEYTDEKPNGSPVAMSIRRLRPGDQHPAMAPDPRLIGMVPREWENLSFGESIDAFVGNKNRSHSTLSSERLGGTTVDRIEYRGAKTLNRVWINKEGSYSVVQVETIGESVASRISTQYELHKESGLFVPRSFVFKRTLDGKVTHKQAATIIWKDLNSPDPGKPFAPNQFNIPVGTSVSTDDPNEFGKRIWDGRQTAPQYEKHINAGAASSRKYTAIFLIVNACVLAALGGLLFMKLRKLRK